MNIENYINRTPKNPTTNEESFGDKKEDENKENLKIFDITIDGNQYKLEAKKHLFSYPENIVKETGIKGYERQVINEEQIFSMLNKVLKNKYGKSLEELGYNNLNKLIDEYEKDDSENLDSLAQSIADSGYKFEEKGDRNSFYIKKDLVNITNSIYGALSDNKYPDDVFTFSARHKESMLVEDRFFLQKIFGIESFNKFKEKTGKELFGRTSYPEQVQYYKFDKNTYKIKYFGEDTWGRKIESEPIQKISEEYNKSIKNNDIFYMADNGLNVGERDFFGGFQPLLFNSKPNLGFEIDNYLYDYLTKSINEYREINKANYGEMGDNRLMKSVFRTEDFLKIFAMLEMPTNKSYCEKGKYSTFDVYSHTQEEVDTLYEKAANLINKYGGLLDKNEKAEDYLSVQYVESPIGEKRLELVIKDNCYGEQEFSRHIPIFINDDNIPQLRWGAAKYCSFYNKKGFNFITLEHDDKFPNSVKTK